MTDRRVFNIGLPKTGTLSLNDACTVLGLRSAHCPGKAIIDARDGKYDYPALRRRIRCGDGEFNVPQVVTDFGAWQFAQLDAAFPDSLFILTVREMGAWLESCRKMYTRPARTAYRLMLFGTEAYHRERFRWVQETHTKLVCDYFDSPNHTLSFGWKITGRFMIWDVCRAASWEPLCTFLDCEEPETVFPWANKAHYVVRDRMRRQRKKARVAKTVEKEHREQG